MNALTMGQQRKKERDSLSWIVLGGTVLLSLIGHIATIINMPNHAPAREIVKPLDMEIRVVEPPKPPPPPPEPEKPPEPPKVKPPPVKVAMIKPPLVPPTPPPPTEPPAEPPKEQAPPIIGMTLTNNPNATGFAAPTGNSAYGKVADKAVDPALVKPYAGPPNYVPAGSADTDPERLDEVKGIYPDEARSAGIEGAVRLKITIDDQGRVVSVVILAGPGYGLNEAAREAMKRTRFKPAMKNGQAVSTTIQYTYTFELD